MDIANIASAKPYVILINILSRSSKSLMLTIFFTTFSNKFYHQYLEQDRNIEHDNGLNLGIHKRWSVKTVVRVYWNVSHMCPALTLPCTLSFWV
jgi:hypothetical protein